MISAQVSVIIPCYKMGRFLGEALESVGSQTYSGWEVIAVDDAGPEDGTRQIIADFARQFPDHRVEFLCHETNRGAGAARNTAMSAAKGRLLAFLDPDDYWFPNHLELHLRVRDDKPGILVSASGVKMFTRDKRETDGGSWCTSPWEAKIFPFGLAMRNSIIPSAAVVAAEAASQIGGFETAPQIQRVEDWDFWLRLAEIGAPFVFIPETTVAYRKHPGGATSNAKVMEEQVRALMRKHHDRWPSLAAGLLLQQHYRMENLEGRLLELESAPLARVSRRIYRSWKKLRRAVGLKRK
jgi:glycosyltransferase involved in cell wall biosynthesis